MKLRHLDAHRGNWQEFMRQSVDDWLKHPNLTEEEWKAITCPVFFISGEFDPFSSCNELIEKFPHAELFEAAGCGHRPHFVMEQGKEINQLIFNFLGKIE